MAKVVYHSFDFDGCFSNEASAQALGKNWTASKSNEEANEAYLTANSEILKSFAKGDQTVLLVGSNRQNPHIDLKNGTGTQYPPGSVYPRMEAIATALGATFNPFLLSDLETDTLEMGQTYRKFKEKGYLQENGSYREDVTPLMLRQDGFLMQKDDESKASLLFAQMQLASMNHPDDVVEFNFYDDRKDIVEGLNNFFQKNPELIPKNVTLNIKGYSGPKLTQEQAQENLTNFIMHTTTDLGSEKTLDVIKDAEKNNFPVLIKIPGEKDEFKLYRRNREGEWGFEDFDGVIPNLESEKFNQKFPKTAGERVYPYTHSEPEIFSYLKNQHFLPIPSARTSSKPVYNYGEPTCFDPIKGEGSIPKEVTDWHPAYNAMRQAAKVSEMDDNKISVVEGFTSTKFITQINLIIEKKLSELQGELTLEERNELESSLIDLYKAKINSDNMQLSSKDTSITDLKDARNELCTSISEALKSPKLNLKDCQNLDNIIHHANIAIDPNKDSNIKFNSICELGMLSDEVVGKKSETLGAVSAACGMLAIVAAMVAIALAPTGIGFAIGFAVAGALAAASIGTGIAAKSTETDLAEKTRNFRDALENIRDHQKVDEEQSLDQSFEGLKTNV